MRTILAIETSSELASAALLYQGQILSEESAGVQTHSQTLLPMVQKLFAEAGVPLSQCDAVAFGAGPGSFTGVRTACGVAQGLAFGLDIPVVPVVTLKAMAHGCRETSGASDVLVLLDARMEEVYWAQYRYADGWQIVSEPALSAPVAVMPVGNPVACGNGLAAYATALSGRSFLVSAKPDIVPHARDIAKLAQMEFKPVAACHAQPIYLRNKVAMTTVERLAKAAV
jgi:tRNA threonylcarbamoyladenosine biosynthesis protein TsaB